MKIISVYRSLAVTALGLVLATKVQAQLPIDGVHYPVGLEGIKGGSLPEPGIYVRDNNLLYTSTSDFQPDFSTLVYLQAPQMTWMTGWKILGANYGMDVMVPLIYKQIHYNQTPFFGGGGGGAPYISEGVTSFGITD